MRSAGGPPRLLAALWSHRWFALAAAIALGAGMWQAVRVYLGPAVVVDGVRRGDLVQTLVASGHVETPFRVDIGSQITGVVDDVLVSEGERVSQGQPLIRLQSAELRAAVVQAESAVAQARARLRQLAEVTLPVARETLAQAEAARRGALATHERVVTLFERGTTTRAALDEATRALDTARAQVNAAKLLVFTASEGGSDEVLARTQLAQAEAMLDTARSRLSYATIAAPRDGVLIGRAVERGAVAQPGKTLLVLAPLGEMQLVLQIDERHLGRLAVGQEALASADAYPDERFRARVTFINPGVDLARASVEVKLRAENPPPFLRQDMTVSVDIEIARRTNTLIVPARSVRDLQSGRPWALKVRGERAARAEVKTGVRGQTQVEILEGLADGDLVVPATAGLLNGQRLRPVPP